MKLYAFSLSLSLLALVACSPNTDHAGIETTNGISAELVLANGSPAASAKVALVRPGSHIAFDSVTTDATGRFVWEGSRDSAFDVFAQADSQSLLLRLDPRDSAIPHDLGALNMLASASLSGKLQSPGADQVWVEGTTLQATPDSSGKFILKGLPATAVALFMDSAGQEQYLSTLTPSSGQSFDSLQVMSRDYFLLDGYDDKDCYNNARPFTQASQSAVLRSDSTVKVLPTGVSGRCDYALDGSAAAWSGSSVHLRFAFPTDASSASVVGWKTRLDPGHGRAYGDFSSLTSITFMAKGSGQIRVQFTSKAIIDLTGKDATGPQLDTVITLSPAWSRVKLEPLSFHAPAGSPSDTAGYTFARVANALRSLEFVAVPLPGDTVDFWLDDVRLYGIGSESFR